MLNVREKDEIRRRIGAKLAELEERVQAYKELVRPIAPENAIGRVSRMDAINNKSVNEAALREAEAQVAALKRALTRLDDDRFGMCTRCGNAIPTGRILLVPAALTCVQCAR
jgi:DnaK suppressor protein